MSPKLCIVKAAQVGLSVCEILKVFFMAKKMGIDVVYTLPTDTDVQTMVGGKVNRIIAQNPILQTYTQDKDSVFQKQVGESMVYFRSTFSKKMATMITADWLIHDEADSSKQDVIEMYQSRLQASKHKLRHLFSHPSIPGYGVDVEWRKSDQRHWFITCQDCKKEQYLDWPDSICAERRCFVCKLCKTKLTDLSRRLGRWVPKFKDREWVGYWVSLLMCPWVTAEEILKKWEDPDTSKEFFYNMILGKAYQSEEGGLTYDDLMRNVTQGSNTTENVVIGCDSGNWKHYVVGNKEGLFYHGKTEKWEDIADLLRMYKRSILVVDALPDLTGPRQLREQFPGRVFLSFYHEDKKTMQLVRWGKHKEEGIVHIDRNRMLSHVVEEFKDRRIPLFGKPDEWEPFVKHWLNIFRVKEEDSLGKPVFRWEKRNTEDHYCHSLAYFRAGVSRFGGKGEVIGAGSPVVPINSVKLDADGTAKIDRRLYALEDSAF